ncbi:hypothetical protein STEG23_036723 [Scotinomys teguina]
MEQSKLHKNVGVLTLEKNRLLEDWVLLKHHLGDLKLLDEDQEETSDLQNQQQQEQEQLEKRLQSLPKQREMVTQQIHLARKLQHHLAVSQMRTEVLSAMKYVLHNGLPRHCQHVHHNQRSIRYHGPGWKLFPCLGKGFRNYNQGQMEHMRQNWHQGPSREKDCQGVFDLYFILDKSGSMTENWKNVYSFTDNLVKKFQNPKLQMSFITYSMDTDILLPLTSDREEIHSDLLRLQKLVPEGRTSMQKGIMKANKSRRMGAAVYTMGVHEYDKQQDIIDLVSKWDVEDWGDPVCIPRGLLDPLVSRSCSELLFVQPSTVCIKDSYEVKISGHGFGNLKALSQVLCRFTFSDSRIVGKPGHMQQLLSTVLPPDAIDVVSSYGPGLDTIDSMLIMISFDSEEHQQDQLNPDVS